MKAPISWIRQYVPLKISPLVLAEKLTMAGMEVEDVIDRKNALAGIVVGEILDIKPHPDADKLRIASVRIKPLTLPQDIVCGAPNIAIGQKVAVAKVGATLPNGLTIESRAIRGVTSNGMVCSESELGLSSDHTGIMVLGSSLKVGTPLASVLGFEDLVFDISLPSNRSDLFSIRGLAREVAVVTGVKTTPAKTQLSEAKTTVKSIIQVSVAKPALCPLYTVRVIRGVTVTASPLWLQQRLRSAGIRPINAVVDATNYVMLDLGQPMHAFDAMKIHGGRVSIRPAKANETLVTLDGKERKLDPSMLVIADTSGAIALAGVMGGQETEISTTTTDIILEAAIFDPVSVRKTSRKLGLQSEASHRFEKGLPLSLPEEASRAAAALITELCGGVVQKGSVTVGRVITKPVNVSLSPTMFSSYLGLPVTPAQAKSILEKLGFRITGGKSWKVRIPEWRLDVRLAEDVVEEVGRILGYNQLPEELPNLVTIPQPAPVGTALKEEISDELKGFGFVELISHAYYSEHWKSQYPGQYFEISNPLDKSQQYLRRSQLPNVREVLEHAVDAGEDVKVFQIGRVFRPEDGKKLEDQQPWTLAIGLAKKNGAGKNITPSGVMEALGMPAAALHLNAQSAGTQSSKGRNLSWMEVDLTVVAKFRQPNKFQPLAKFPAIRRDISIWLPEEISTSAVEQMMLEIGRPLLTRVKLEDVFTKDDRRSVTFALTFQAADRTLSASEVDTVMETIIAKVGDAGAEVRA